MVEVRERGQDKFNQEAWDYAREPQSRAVLRLLRRETNVCCSGNGWQGFERGMWATLNIIDAGLLNGQRLGLLTGYGFVKCVNAVYRLAPAGEKLV